MYLTGIPIRFGNNLQVLDGKDWKDENFFPLKFRFYEKATKFEKKSHLF